ncbi:MAG: EF-hand domain-containing protein [Candidatus Omnitrophota bacterium]
MANSAKTGVLFFYIILFSCINAFAQQNVGFMAPEEIREQQIKAKFQEIDTDKDGFITPDEMEAEKEKFFNRLDKDQNGLLDAEEMKADNTPMSEEADKDKDQVVTPEEADAQFKKYLNEVDTDKDGKVSEDEYTDYWKLRIKF